MKTREGTQTKTNSAPTYMRQRYLLSVLNQAEDALNAISIQKLVFLNEQEYQIEHYDFIPYRYGPYSFQLANDLDTLCLKGFAKKHASLYYPQYSMPFQFLSPIAKERGNELIKRTYREFPYYAINSEILEQLFDKEEAKKIASEKEKYVDDQKKLYTIGYEGRSLEGFINTLIQKNIKMVCDVRKNPLSRKFGFSKGTLSHVLPTIGISYINIQGLGIESEKRVDLNTKQDYEKLFIEYENTLFNRKEYLDNVYRLYEQHNRIALLCYEKEPEMCHRHVIRDYMLTHYNNIYSEDI